MVVSGTLASEQRRAALVELAATGATVRVEEAAARFDVSPMTIRRDLMELEAGGRLRRVRGGAVAAPTPKPFVERRTLNVSAKRVIARKAQTLLPVRGTVGLDASSTSSLVAAGIGAREGLSVLTNSIETFARLVGVDGVVPLLSGGAPEPTSGSLTGPLAERSIRSLFYDLVFLSADALDADAGTSEVSLAEADTKRAYADQAGGVVVCADASKLGRRSVAAALATERITVLVTELDPDDPRLDPYRAQVDVL